GAVWVLAPWSGSQSRHEAGAQQHQPHERYQRRPAEDGWIEPHGYPMMARRYWKPSERHVSQIQQRVSPVNLGAPAGVVSFGRSEKCRSDRVGFQHDFARFVADHLHIAVT